MQFEKAFCGNKHLLDHRLKIDTASHCVSKRDVEIKSLAINDMKTPRVSY